MRTFLRSFLDSWQIFSQAAHMCAGAASWEGPTRKFGNMRAPTTLSSPKILTSSSAVCSMGILPSSFGSDQATAPGSNLFICSLLTSRRFMPLMPLRLNLCSFSRSNKKARRVHRRALRKQASNRMPPINAWRTGTACARRAGRSFCVPSCAGHASASPRPSNRAAGFRPPGSARGKPRGAPRRPGR